MTSPLNNLTDTWANSATVFTGLKYNITNTASAAGSLLMDLQIGGNTGFSVDKTGNIKVGALNYGGSYLSTIDCGGNDLRFSNNNGGTFKMNATGMGIPSAKALYWDDGSGDATHFAFMYRDAADIISMRNTTRPQTFQVYNTFTDASNYERGVFDWTTTSNTLTIGTQALGTGSGRELWFVVPGGQVISFVIGGTLYARCSASGFSINSGVLTFQGGPSVGQLSADGSTPTIYVGSSSVGGTDFSGTLKATTVTLNDVSLTRGAAGVFKFGSSASFSANGSVATTMTSLGPTGSHTAVQKWLTIQDSGGGTLYIPCY